MKIKIIPELIVVIIVLASIVILTLNVYFTETEPNVRLLAIGIILSAFLGRYNMFKSLFRSAEAEELRKANRLEEQRQKRQYQNAKDQKKLFKIFCVVRPVKGIEICFKRKCPPVCKPPFHFPLRL